MSTSRGIAASIIIGGVAFGADYFLKSQQWFSPGASTLALILGALSAIWLTGVEAGGRWMTKRAMPVAIVLLGFGLDLALFSQPAVGAVGLAVALSASATCLISSYLIGRAMGLDLGTSVAIGAGGAICGNSAVIAVAPSLKLTEERFAVILAMVNILGLLTFICIPLLTSGLGLSEVAGGIWAGSVVHAVPQAVAAGESIGEEALVIATAVKLSRVSLLVLIVPLCAWIGRRIDSGEDGEKRRFALPYFVPGFILAACLSTWVLPELISGTIMQVARYMLLPLLAAVGFFINKKSMQHAGGPVLAVGVLSTALMVGVSYGMLQLLS